MAKLAIHGGPKTRTQPFHRWPVHGRREFQALTQVLESGHWWHNIHGAASGHAQAPGESQIAKFQRGFADYHKAKYGLACCNGTAALEIALKAMGLKPGDEVICPPYTFIATSNAVLLTGGVPVFVDIHPDTYNLNPDLIEEAITERTAGIVPVHFGGEPADMARINAIARKHGLFVLEDACHAHGGMYRKKYCGTLGDAAAFSFQMSKNMTAGEGGMILTNKKRLAERMESLINCGRPVKGHWYMHADLGWNYRMGEFNAALLNCQLERLEKQTATRDRNGRYLDEKLAAVPGLSPRPHGTFTTVNTHHVHVIRYREEELGIPRARFLEAVRAEGIPMSDGYIMGLYDLPFYRERNFWNSPFPVGDRVDYARDAARCPATERACKSEALWLPQTVFLGSRRDMNDIYKACRKVADCVDELR